MWHFREGWIVRPSFLDLLNVQQKPALAAAVTAHGRMSSVLIPD